MRRNSGRGAFMLRGGRNRGSQCGVIKRHESHFGDGENHAETLRNSIDSLGQSDPGHYPPRNSPEFPLGSPIDIEDVAELLGCSPWTVRQKYLPQGLPHLRASASGKFVFFRGQIVHWILERQTKGRR